MAMFSFWWFDDRLESLDGGFALFFIAYRMLYNP